MRAHRVFTALILIMLSISAAAQSGVLVSVRGSRLEGYELNGSENSEIQSSIYQTFWLVPTPGGDFKVEAKLPAIVVPHGDEFWVIGTARLCEFEEGNESIRVMVWAAPAGKPAIIEHSPLCEKHDPEDYTTPEGKGSDPAEKDKITQCGYLITSVTSVTPSLISLHLVSSQSESCEARGGRYESNDWVLHFDLGKPLRFRDVFGVQRLAFYRRALPKEAGDDAGQSCVETDPKNDAEWDVSLYQGRWRLHAIQNLGYFGCLASGEVKIATPRALTGALGFIPSWNTLKKKIPNLMEGYASPAVDMVIALTTDGLSTYPVKNNTPGKRGLVLPLDQAHAWKIVSVQWASGKHLNDWSQRLQKLEHDGIPDPVLKLKVTEAPQ